jgi:alginate O-acetyltransferase complex protein AlgI
MLFNSRVFLYGFLPIVYLIYWRLRDRNSRYLWLAVSGYIFYGWWDYRFCGLMLFSTVVSFCAGVALDGARSEAGRRAFLIFPIAVDLALLGFFKYAGFTIRSLNVAANWFGMATSLPVPSIILPVGISFYTFHTITYIVDTYRRTIRPTRNFLEFSCYVSLFSQLVAGPIVRFRQIEKDLDHIDAADRRSSLAIGCSFFALGLIEKVIIADGIASSIDSALRSYQKLSSTGVWLCVIGYAYQLYFDFSGYSTMAVGLGHMFGLRLPQNFNSPYKAVNPSDFWTRWHISLSTVLRDYLYIPLGGNRCSRSRQFSNLMVTMLLGGLWHGANWTFVFWGGYHGALLVLYRLGQRWWDALPVWLARSGTFLAVVVGWLFFRSPTFSMASSLCTSLVRWHGGQLPQGIIGLLFFLGVGALWAHWGKNPFEFSHSWTCWEIALITALCVISLVVITAGRQSPFLYFQF